jgi:hypothetical protein
LPVGERDPATDRVRARTDGTGGAGRFGVVMDAHVTEVHP